MNLRIKEQFDSLFCQKLPLCVHRQKRSPLKELQRKINISFGRQSNRLRSGRLLNPRNNKHRLHRQIQQGQFWLMSILVKVHIPHKEQIPHCMHEFIEKVVDVTCDGHYGFRAIAGLHNLSFDDHQMICYQLHKELIGEENARYRRMINDDRRYISRMTDYNELGRAASVDVIGDDQDLYIIENLDPKDKVVDENKTEDGVKIEKGDSFNLDNVDIYLGAD
ncbi:hypothetical protein MTR_3g463560 [Medicago truncatula]|uniref:Uncharacterized protein n=1 Tax=Medicago truncatula TaxID=3880 RepID=A0A072UXD2_MEDTR|nr:hypothetical protein MTR_3g463560 [Medicago truncatula]